MTISHKRSLFIGAAFIFGLLIGLVPFALRASQSQPSMPQTLGGPGARIVVDEIAGRVGIEIGGKQVAFFDTSGLHVEADIVYRGTITDINHAE